MLVGVLKFMLVLSPVLILEVFFLFVVRLAIGVVEGVVDSVLVEVNRFDIVLVVIRMVKGVMSLVLSVPLRLVVRVLVMSGLVVNRLVMNLKAVLSLVSIAVMRLHIGPVVVSFRFMMAAELVGSHLFVRSVTVSVVVALAMLMLVGSFLLAQEGTALVMALMMLVCSSLLRQLVVRIVMSFVVSRLMVPPSVLLWGFVAGPVVLGLVMVIQMLMLVIGSESGLVTVDDRVLSFRELEAIVVVMHSVLVILVVCLSVMGVIVVVLVHKGRVMLDVSVLVGAAVGVVEGMVDGMLVEVNGLDVMSIIVAVVKGMMSLVLSVPLGCVVGAFMVFDVLVEEVVVGHSLTGASMHLGLVQFFLRLGLLVLLLVLFIIFFTVGQWSQVLGSVDLCLFLVVFLLDFGNRCFLLNGCIMIRLTVKVKRLVMDAPGGMRGLAVANGGERGNVASDIVGCGVGRGTLSDAVVLVSFGPVVSGCRQMRVASVSETVNVVLLRLVMRVGRGVQVRVEISNAMMAHDTVLTLVV